MKYSWPADRDPRSISPLLHLDSPGSKPRFESEEEFKEYLAELQQEAILENNPALVFKFEIPPELREESEDAAYSVIYEPVKELGQLEDISDHRPTEAKLFQQSRSLPTLTFRRNTAIHERQSEASSALESERLHYQIRGMASYREDHEAWTPHGHLQKRLNLGRPVVDAELEKKTMAVVKLLYNSGFTVNKPLIESVEHYFGRKGKQLKSASHFYKFKKRFQRYLVLKADFKFDPVTPQVRREIFWRLYHVAGIYHNVFGKLLSKGRPSLAQWKRQFGLSDPNPNPAELKVKQEEP